VLFRATKNIVRFSHETVRMYRGFKEFRYIHNILNYDMIMLAKHVDFNLLLIYSLVFFRAAKKILFDLVMKM